MHSGGHLSSLFGLRAAERVPDTRVSSTSEATRVKVAFHVPNRTISIWSAWCRNWMPCKLCGFCTIAERMCAHASRWHNCLFEEADLQFWWKSWWACGMKLVRTQNASMRPQNRIPFLKLINMILWKIRTLRKWSEAQRDTTKTLSKELFSSLSYLPTLTRDQFSNILRHFCELWRLLHHERMPIRMHKYG